MKTYCKTLIPLRPCKDSDADIGFFISIADKKDLDYRLYGHYYFGFFIGKHLFRYDSKHNFRYCDIFATGLGG